MPSLFDFLDAARVLRALEADAAAGNAEAAAVVPLLRAWLLKQPSRTSRAPTARKS